jgi:DNA-binding MarR family transcriptional regulator
MSGAHHEPEPADAAQAALAIFRLYRGLECVEAGLTPAQYRIMKLAEAGGERSTRLAQRLAVAKPTLTAIADGLVAAGYARRAPEPGDRRVVRLSLTPAGRAALGRADAAYAAWLGQLLEGSGQPATVLDALGRLDAALTDLRRGPRHRDQKHGNRKDQGHEYAAHHDHSQPAAPDGG